MPNPTQPLPDGTTRDDVMGVSLMHYSWDRVSGVEVPPDFLYNVWVEGPKDERGDFTIIEVFDFDTDDYEEAQAYAYQLAARFGLGDIDEYGD